MSEPGGRDEIQRALGREAAGAGEARAAVARQGGTAEPSPGQPATYELASWGVRAAAFMLDMLLQVAVSLVPAAVVLAIEGDGADARRTAEMAALVVALVVGLLYAPLLMLRRGKRNGQTLGKQALGIRVVRENGERMGLVTGVWREVFGRQLLVGITYGLYALIDYLWPVWDERRQCIHDKLARTRVVRVAPVADGAPTFSTTPDAREAPAAAAPPTEWPPAPPAPVPPVPAPPAPEPSDRPVRDGWLPPSAGR